MRRFFSKYFVFFLIIFLLYLLERGEMAVRFGVYESSFAYQNIFVVAMIILSTYYVLVNNRSFYYTRFFKRFSATLILIYFLTVIWSLADPLHSRNVYGFLILPLFLYAFIFVYTIKTENTNVILYSFYSVGLLLAAYFFMNYNNNVFYDIEQQTNTSYAVLYFLPMMLCAPKKWLRYAAIVLTIFTVMFSLKRGGFVAILMAAAAFFYISEVKLGGRRLRIWGWLLFVVIGIVGYWAVTRINDIMLDNLMFNRMSYIEETEGSGRGKIWRNVIEMIGSQGAGGLLVGHGWRATADNTISHLTAHNDFLEILYDFGIVAFVLYLLMISEMIRLTRFLIKNKSEYAPAMGAMLVIFFVNSMVSHIMIYCQYLLIFSLSWGFFSAAIQRDYLTKKM